MAASSALIRRRGRRLAAVLMVAGLVLVAIAVFRHWTGRGPSVAAGPPRTLPVDARGRHPFAGLQQTRVQLTLPAGQQLEWCLMVAVSNAQQDQGLMGVTDPALGGFDGMLFSFSQPTDTQFWMKDTPLPLSIAFFDANGRYISSTDMAPCGNVSTCPDYSARSSYESAVEVPQGRLAALGIGEGSTLQREPGACNVRAEAASPLTTLASS